MAKDGLSIGELADRSGLAVSAIRYYETQGLIRPWRNAGGQRRFQRADLRRLSFVMVAQQFDFSLGEIRALLDGLPGQRTPTKADWTKMADAFRGKLNARIATLERLRDKLDGCIGCGCLSLPNCQLYNPEDQAAERGQGPRFVLEDNDAPASDAELSG
jgi:MerR family redox-sensitive transcriptional activator SoxR